MSSTKSTLSVWSSAISLYKRGHVAHVVILKEKSSSSPLGPKFQVYSDKMENRQVAQPPLLFSQ